MKRIAAWLFFYCLTIVNADAKDFYTLFGPENIINNGHVTWVNIDRPINLKGETVTLPSGTVLNFVGGYIEQGEIKGKNIKISSQAYRIFEHVRFDASFDIDCVLPEWFGAKGDGVTDDTYAFEQALSTGQTVQLGRHSYVVKHTLNVDISSQSIIGQDGLSTLVCSSDFKGDCCLLLHNSNDNYYSRYCRMRRISDFRIRGNKKVDGIQVGNNGSSGYNNAVDELLFENIYIEYTRTALVLGNHFYKCTFTHCTFREQEYAVRSIEKQYDSGEAVLFIACAFFDSKTRMELACSLNFISCTSHGNWRVSGDAQIVCQSCHFERTKGNEVPDDPLFHTSGTSSLILRDCEAVISNGIWKYKDYAFLADDYSKIIIENGTWEYFLKRAVTTDKHCLAKGDVAIRENKLPFKWESNFLVNQIYDYSSTNLLSTTTPIAEQRLICNLGDVYTQRSINGKVQIKIDLSNANLTDKKVWIGKIEPVRSSAKTIWAQEKISFRDSPHQGNLRVSFNTGANSFEGFCFLDSDYNIINQSDNKAVFSQILVSGESSKDIVFSYPLSVPNNAAFVMMGITMFLDKYEGGDIVFDFDRFMLEFL